MVTLNTVGKITKGSGFQYQIDTVMISYAVRSEGDIDEIRTMMDEKDLEIMEEYFNGETGGYHMEFPGTYIVRIAGKN